jgi:hypothetical protein
MTQMATSHAMVVPFCACITTWNAPPAPELWFPVAV